MIRGVDPDSIPRYEIPEQVYADYDDEPATGACWNCDHMTEIKLGGKSCGRDGPKCSRTGPQGPSAHEPHVWECRE